MDFIIQTHVHACGITTNSGDLASLFVAMASKIIAPDRYIELVTGIAPQYAEMARQLVKNCLGIGV